MHFQRSVITLWYHVFLVGYGPTYPKFSEATNGQYLWKGSSDFVDFFQLLICILLNIHYPLKLFWAGILRYSVSANQIVRCFKLTNFENNITYYVDFLLPLKLKEMPYNFGLWPQNALLANRIAGFFYFWLVWLVKLIPGVHCYVILVNSEEWCFEFQLHCNRTYSQHNYSRILYFTGGENSKECLYGNSKYCRSWWYVYFFLFLLWVLTNMEMPGAFLFYLLDERFYSNNKKFACRIKKFTSICNLQ